MRVRDDDMIAVEIARDGLMLALLLVAPVVLTALAVGLVVGIVQAATQVQENTVAFVPRLAAIVVALLLAGPWMGGQLLRFTQRVFLAIR